MSTSPDPHALAAARRARIHALRTRVAAIGVAAFLALWGVLYVQLATGHDPGLSAASPVAVVQAADPEVVTAPETPDTATAAATDEDDDDDAVTTRQS